ncbi:unnamed protein product [Rhizoctonia solani]|uniref:Uncharacterized protein n=1 Tax=Rhizoctonia solani TaxID=456999 RepID=A0A8H3EBW1_9AGAM|nr:unnamed protein product [Rhizoctonia solani]
MKAVAVIVALFGLAVAAPLSGSATGRPTGHHTGEPRPTGTGAPGHHGHHNHPPFPAFTGGSQSFTGVRPTFTAIRHSGAPLSPVPSPTDIPSQSIAARDLPVYPSGSFSELRPEHTGSFTGRRPEHTGSFTGRSEHTGVPHSLSGERPRPTGSILRGDERPGGSPRPSGFPHSFSGVRPSFTGSHPAPSQSA